MNHKLRTIQSSVSSLKDTETKSVKNESKESQPYFIDIMISENNKDKEGMQYGQNGQDKTEEEFVTKRMWKKHPSYEEMTSSIHTILDNMKIDSISLLLIDHKISSNKDVWLALNEAYKFGKIKAFGFTK